MVTGKAHTQLVLVSHDGHLDSEDLQPTPRHPDGGVQTPLVGAVGRVAPGDHAVQLSLDDGDTPLVLGLNVGVL